MIYIEFKGKQVSRLGMGTMRLPTLGERRGAIDEPKAREIIEHAYAHGINYFDSGYRYHGGQSEPFVGKVLSQYPRDTWYLATKLPGHQMAYRDGKLEFVGYLAGEAVKSPEAVFEDQLARCGVDYFDFYLLHNVAETSYDFYTDADLAVVDMLLEQKSRGRIHHLGFSSHARAHTLEQYLDRFPGIFEFVQMQLNYLDWTVQDARRKYEILTERGIPVWVMEPVRGGRLASPGAEGEALLEAARPDASIASWAFRFAKSLPNVGVVLSGMTTMAQLVDNLQTFADPVPLTDAERALLDRVVAVMADTIPCTACRYCCEVCPQELDIPRLIALYNEMAFEPRPDLLSAIHALDEEYMPSACIADGACAQACPQGIDIPAVMKALAERIEQMTQGTP